MSEPRNVTPDDARPDDFHRNYYNERAQGPEWAAWSWGRRGWNFPWLGILLVLVGVGLLIVGCRGDGRTPVVLYSPHGRDQLTLLEHEFERRRPDIDVRWLDMGSQEVLDRLRFERVNPQADVWFGGPTTIFDRGVHDSLLAPYRPTWAAAESVQRPT